MGIFLWTILLLDFPLMILITLLALFFHGVCGLEVLTSILASLSTLCIYVLWPVYVDAFSINISFDTPTSQFILSNVKSASDLDFMRFIWTKCPSMKIWVHVLLTMYLSFSNSVSVYYLKFSQRSLCDRNYVLYRHVSGFRADLTLSWVVYWRVLFSLSSTVPHFLANTSSLIPWCFLSV